MILIYILARLLKAPLFWVAISPYKRWKLKPAYIKNDTLFVTFIALCVCLFWLLGWLLGTASILLLLIGLFVVKIKE